MSSQHPSQQDHEPLHVNDARAHFHHEPPRATYLPSPRESWSKNGLGGYGIYGFLVEWQSDGRTWKTECDTATTGEGGCRSYILAKHVRAKKAGSTWSYSIVEDWVFNNLVLFSGPTVPPVSTVPNWIVDCPGQWIEPKGLRCGPLRLGSNGDDLTRLGYMSKRHGICGEYWVDSQSVKNRGVRLGVRGNVQDVSVSTNFIRTEIGAHVGMTVGQVKALYGAAFKVVPKENYDGTQYFGTYREGAFESHWKVPGCGGWCEEVRVRPNQAPRRFRCHRGDHRAALHRRCLNRRLLSSSGQTAAGWWISPPVPLSCP